MIITKGGRLPSGVRNTPEVAGLNCTIVVSGELGEQFDDVFADLALSHETGTTRISGAVTDQNAPAGPERAVYSHSFQGGLPESHRSCRWRLSRTVSTAYQKPLWR